MYVGKYKCVSKTHIRQTRGAVKTMCNTHAPFSRATSPSLIVAYCKLLKLTAASNAGVYEKLAILDKLLLITIWTTVLAYRT